MLLIVFSMLLLSVLRIGQYVSDRVDFVGLYSLTAMKPRSPTTQSYDCAHEYTVEILSLDPLIIYINNFLEEVEVQYLLELKKNSFETSQAYDENLKSVIDTRFRTSQLAIVTQDDMVGECLSQRMKSLLGNVQHIETEAIQIVKYEGGERFRIHMDWFDKPRNKTYNPDMAYRPYNRLANIFAYLDDDCTGGETYFPEIQGVSTISDGDEFARTDTGAGSLVKPWKENAVF